MKRLLIICMLVVLGNGVFGQGIEFMDNEPWSKVLQRAKEQNRLIFMDCYTVWCGPCKGLAQDVFPQKQVGDFFNAHFVNVKYDMEKGDGKMLREKYKEYIIGFPTLLLLDGDGNVVHQMAGYQKAENLIAGMKAGMEGKSLPANKETQNLFVADGMDYDASTMRTTKFIPLDAVNFDLAGDAELERMDFSKAVDKVEVTTGSVIGFENQDGRRGIMNVKISSSIYPTIQCKFQAVAKKQE